MRIVFTSGLSLKDMLVKSSFSKPMCPRERQRKAEKKGRGRSYECRACNAGFSDCRCVMKGVVYSMYFAVCGESRCSIPAVYLQ